MASLKQMVKNKEERRFRSNNLEEVVSKMIKEIPILKEDLIFSLYEDKEVQPTKEYDELLTKYNISTKLYTINNTKDSPLDKIAVSILREYANVAGGYMFRDFNTRLKGDKRELLLDFQEAFEDYLYDYNPIVNYEHYRIKPLDRWLVDIGESQYLDENTRVTEVCHKLWIEINDQIIRNVQVWGKLPYLDLLEKVTNSIETKGTVDITDYSTGRNMKYDDGMIIFTDPLGNMSYKGSYKSITKESEQQSDGPKKETTENKEMKGGTPENNIDNYKNVKLRIKENDLYLNTDVSWFYRLQNILNLYTPETFASYKTPDRRFAFYGLIVQGPYQEQKQNISGVDIFIDTSASMTQDKIIRAVSVVKSSALAQLQNKYHVFGSYVLEITEADIRKGEYTRFGGTQIKPVVEQIALKGKNRLSLIISDGEFDWRYVDTIQNEAIFLCLSGKKLPNKPNVHIIKAKEF